METSLVELCQQHLIQACLDRIQHTESVAGSRFGFEIIQRENTAVVLAHHWPENNAKFPFHRVFNYSAPPDNSCDPLLDRLVDEKIDAVIEVLPGPHQSHTEQVLRSRAFEPVWSIPWLYIPVEEFSFKSPAASSVERINSTRLMKFAEIFVDGYGYSGKEAEAWRIYSQHGYTAPQFSCFLASHNEQPAATGVVHLHKTSALVDGAATLPQYRNLGLQKLLLATRIRYAKEHGALHAFSRTGRGSISETNMRKLGMRIFVQSIAWRKN